SDLAAAVAPDLPKRREQGALETGLRRLESGRILGRDFASLLRQLSFQQLESQLHRHARTIESLRPGRLRTGADDFQFESRTRLALSLAAKTAERHRAARAVQN